MSDRLQDAANGRGTTKGLGGWANGRARRREYWAWAAPLSVAILALAATGIPAIALLAGIPMLLVTIRRLHDLGFTGWIAPVINIGVNGLSFAASVTLSEEVAGLLALVIFYAPIITLGVLPGQRTTNRFGPPRGKAGVIAETFS